MRLHKEDLVQQDNRYRALFINSLSGYKSANLIATCDQSKNTNLAIFTSVFHIGSEPPLLGMLVRPHSVTRDTLENILQTKSYSINHVNEAIFRQAHQTSARYPKDTSEFSEVGLSEQWHDHFPAPFVKESRIQLGMELREHNTLSLNDTVLVIGEIVFIDIKDDIVKDDGYVDIEQARSIAVSSLDSYHRTEMLTSLSYAKPERDLVDINRRKA